MTPRLSDTRERISPEDLYWARMLAFKLTEEQKAECRTYALHITSDSVPEREETQS